jgi:TolB-like protein
MRKVLLGFVFLFAVFAAGAQQKTRVAVFPFEVTDYAVNASEAVTIREDFSNRLAQTGLFALVPRSDVDKLYQKEAAFQLSDLSDSAKTAEYGRVLNANWIIAGRLSKAGSRLALVVSMYTYPDFVQKPGSQVYAPNTDTLIDGIPGLIADIQTAHGGTPSAAATRPAAAVPAAKTTYKIGEAGPAGGIVFYDKGVVTNGWRYLEAAPNDIGPAQWGARGTEISGINTAVGTGKANTQRIIPVLEQAGEDGAALLCASVDINGHTGWFLPSKDELNLMYANLKAKGLGGFGNGRYWSSSQGHHYGYSSAEHTWTQSFSDGSQAGNGKNETISVRAIRQF